MSTSRAATNCSAFALILLAASLQAQATQPVNGSLLRPGVDTFTVSYGGQVIGRGIQVLSEALPAAPAAWKQTYTFQSLDGDASTDTLFMDRLTLRPIREARASSVGRFSIAFQPQEIVSISLAAVGGPVTTRTPLAAPVFSSASLEAVVRSLPLANGMQATVDLFYPLPATTGARQLGIRVVRSEAVATRGGGSRTAWVVVAGEPGEATTFWVDKADRTLLQFDTEEGSALIQFRR